MFDVIVVGTGPAGASAAFELSRSGLRVLMLERQKLPRYKACGGAIPFNFFQTLPPRTQKTLETFLDRGLYFGSGNKKFEPNIAIKVAAVMRDRFDYEFAQAAVDEGAELVDGNPVIAVTEEKDRVSIKTQKGIFQGRYLVGADGATGVIKRRLGIGSRNPPAPAMEVEIPHRQEAAANHPTLIHFTLIRDGYAWVFPKAGIHSVGILSFNRDRQKVREKLAEWTRLCGYRLEGESLHGHPIPVWQRKNRLATGRSLLVGDAADTVDPLGGEGIRHGIISGRIAAQYLQDALAKTGTISQKYNDAIYRAIQSDFVYARRLAFLFYRFPGFFFDLWVRTNEATDFMGKVLYGESRYEDLFRLALRSFLQLKHYRRLLQNKA